MTARTQMGAIAVAACALAACGRPITASPNAGLQHGALHGANVLLITVDTLRADRVGAYGGGGLTPAIDGLAASGVRFTDAHAHAPLTLPAHTSILTGLTPATHGVHTNGANGLNPQVPTLAERLRDAGYDTGAFIGAFVLDARFGLNRGFREYDDRVGSGTGPITFAFAERTADRVAKAAGDWILQPSASGHQPWFAWIHLFDPHAPYRAHQSRAANPYDGEVAFADAEIGRLFDRLRTAGQWDRTLVVLLADHGESLGEHGEDTHGLFAYDATLRIPLVIAGPSVHGYVSDGAVAQADVLPTVLDLVGLEPPPALDGRSMLPAIRGVTAPARPIYIEALDAYLTRNWAPLTGVIDHGWKYIDLPEAELYDLHTDPAEQHNLAGREPQRVLALRREIAGWRRQATALPATPAPSLDPSAVARLRSLGYVAASQSRAVRGPYGVADDPKRLLDLDRRYQRALTQTGNRQFGEAVALLRSVIAERPDFTLAYTNLASVLIESGRPQDAIALLEGATRTAAAGPDVTTRLGAAYVAAEQPDRAAAVLEPLVARGDGGVDAVNTLAVALSSTGRRERARQLFARVLTASPDSATTWHNLGLLELSSHRLRDAEAAFEKAVVADPGFAPAWQALGATRAGQNPDGAIEAWRRAVALAPGDFDVLFNLSVLLHERGRHEEARPYIERFIRDAPPSRYTTDIATLRGWLQE